MLFNIQDLVDDLLYYEKIRELRWSEGVKCPHCGSKEHKRHGHHNNCEHRHHYQCKKCGKYYDDLSNTVFQGGFIIIRMLPDVKCKTIEPIIKNYISCILAK